MRNNSLPVFLQFVLKGLRRTFPAAFSKTEIQAESLNFLKHDIGQVKTQPGGFLVVADDLK